MEAGGAGHDTGQRLRYPYGPQNAGRLVGGLPAMCSKPQIIPFGSYANLVVLINQHDPFGLTVATSARQPWEWDCITGYDQSVLPSSYSVFYSDL